jgi:hypothetical protein
MTDAPIAYPSTRSVPDNTTVPGSQIPLPAPIQSAMGKLKDAFYNSVPFKRVANVNAAFEQLHAAIAGELRVIAVAEDEALLAAAQICESRSRTLKSKPAQIEALQCGSAIHTGGRRWLTRMREERKDGLNTATPSPDAGVAEHESVGTTSMENG